MVVQGDKSIEPYRHEVWAEFYRDGEWLSADGIRAIGLLSHIANELPVVTFTDTLNFDMPAQIELNFIEVYDSDYNPVLKVSAEEEFVTSAGNLDSGTYYVAVNVTRKGEYIEAEDKHNTYGEEYVFKMTVGAGT